ncbi:hypothetical protein BGW42_004122 [Actinomortierella wolfii]|nr:hypothetical protein BGW42_004122 [Actinomortierella wolfii]
MLNRFLSQHRLLRIPAASSTARFFGMSSQIPSSQENTREAAVIEEVVSSQHNPESSNNTQETTVHIGSKRHKESKHNHYGGQQLNKPKKYKINPSENEESLNNAEYFFEHGLRKVKPYFYRYQTYAKGRWLGRELIEVMRTEFQDRDAKYYVRSTQFSSANRLDRLTSGLMLIAKSVEKAREIESMMRQCVIHKQYVCKVKGEFPSGVTECHQPIKIACFKLTLSVVHPEGKPCSTVFERLQYDPQTNTSVVLAKPITGRTHQIRVHLQYLGHPIANDPLYHDTSIWGPTNGQGGVSEEVEKAVVAKFQQRADQEDELDLALAADSAGLIEVENSQAGFCNVCRQPNKPDPPPEKRSMYLHAWKYQTADWSYETELPVWAKDAATAVAAATTTTTTTTTTTAVVDDTTTLPNRNIESSAAAE